MFVCLFIFSWIGRALNDNNFMMIEKTDWNSRFELFFVRRRARARVKERESKKALARQEHQNVIYTKCEIGPPSR